MLAELAGSLIGAIANKVGGVFGGAKKALELQPDSAEKTSAKVELHKAENSLVMILSQKEVDLQRSQDSVRVAEAQSESWLAGNHRPLTMVALTSLIVVNFGGLPMTGKAPITFPVEFWWFAGAVYGTKILGRSAEKIARAKANGGPGAY